MSSCFYPSSSLSDFQIKIPSLQFDNSIEFSKARILQKTIVYIIGLSETLANQETLSRYECLGQYGKIKKIVVNKSGYTQNYQKDITYSAYVTYSSQMEASLALLVVDNCLIDGHTIRCSFGTTKYCTFFLKGISCINKDCLYLHKWANEEDTIMKDDIANNKQIFYTQQKIALKIADVFNKEKKKQIMSKRQKVVIPSNIQPQFPSVETIYHKDNLYKLARELKGSKLNDGYYCKKNAMCNNNNSINNNINNNKDISFGSENKEDEIEFILIKANNKKRKNAKINDKEISQCDKEFNEKNSDINNNSNNNKYDEINSFFMINDKGEIERNIMEILTFYSSEKVIKKYTVKCKSRYDFVDETKEGGVFVPEIISDIINVNLSKFASAKKSSECSSIEIKEDFNFYRKKEKVLSWNCQLRNID